MGWVVTQVGGTFTRTGSPYGQHVYICSQACWHLHTWSLACGRHLQVCSWSLACGYLHGCTWSLACGHLYALSQVCRHLCTGAWPVGTCMFAPEAWPVGTYMPSACSVSTGKRGASAYASCTRQVGTLVTALEALGLTGRSTHGVEHKRHGSR